MKPEDIAKVVKFRGPEFFAYVKKCLALAPAGLAASRVEAFANNPAKNPLADDEVTFLADCLKQRFVNVDEYSPHTGAVVRSAMVRIASTKSAAPVILGVKNLRLGNEDPRLAEYMNRNYAIGQGRTVGGIIPARNDPRTTPSASDAAYQRALAEEQARVAKPTPLSKLVGKVVQMGTAGRAPVAGA